MHFTTLIWGRGSDQSGLQTLGHNSAEKVQVFRKRNITLWTPLTVKSAEITCLDVDIQVWSNKCHWTTRSDVHIHIGQICLFLKRHLLQGPSVRTCVDPEQSRFCPTRCLAALQTLLSDVSRLCGSGQPGKQRQGLSNVHRQTPMAPSVPDHCTAPLLSVVPVTEMSENERRVSSRTVLLFILTRSLLWSTVIPRSRLAGPCKALSPEKQQKSKNNPTECKILTT